MLPSILAKQLQKGIVDYLKTTFPMTDAPFKGSINHMVETHPEAVYRDPYIAVRLPFRVSDSMPTCFESIHMQFKPYVHQAKAFERLTGDDGRSTLIATGTGSGKTECFLYPILEYCYQHRGEPGIKALIIYPMNALATDQARRIAELIDQSPELKGNVTAGMYVGGDSHDTSRMMSPHGIITDHETLLNRAPDILMTNYKMLDYLLVRPHDATLWRDNKPETLHYIAVDELHTFDGAQGTDLACLLRRLKARLGTQGGTICCIGTSATMGSGDSAQSIKEYAENIFGEPFEKDAVITEDRLTAEEFLQGCDVTDFAFPSKEQTQKLVDDVENNNVGAYLRDAARAWLDQFTDDVTTPKGRLTLSNRLMHHSFFQALLLLTEGNYWQDSRVIEELKNRYPGLKELGNLAEVAVDALYALISQARIGKEHALRPFLTVQVQLWLRELRRIVASVDQHEIQYSIAHDLNEQQAKHYLPVVNCRDCGATGWVSYADEGLHVAIKDLTAFYNRFFEADSKIIMMYPYEEGNPVPDTMMKAYLCPNCMKVICTEDKKKEYKCTECGSSTIPIVLSREIKKTGTEAHQQYVCPFCGSHRGISLMGVRSATEISASLSQLFASEFNDDKKTLAFSDNVQDAAHRAGFFNSRTWRFGLRGAIQQYVQHGGVHLSLKAFSDGFIDYWKNKRKLSPEDFVSLFIAPNMTWRRVYEDMVVNRRLEISDDATHLVQDIEKRLKYEIMLEYGLTAGIGRTLVKSGCSALYFAKEDIEAIAERVQERVINELGVLTSLKVSAFNPMVLDVLDRLRRNGAFDDPVFYEMVKNNFKVYLLSSDQHYWMPGLQSGRNTPRFLVDGQGVHKKYGNPYDTVADKKYWTQIERLVNSSEILDLPEGTWPQVARIILQEAVKQQVVSTLPSKPGLTVFGINKDKIYITDKVRQMRCNQCGTVLPIAENNGELWDDMPCPHINCAGYMEEAPEAGLDYYGKLFTNGDLERINAREHTGLLSGDYRTRLEEDFKRSRADRQKWDPNVLSCTPTLEMGIDIGDLSTVILCNMPPAQAQFLQRAGRAGRKDGNAFTLVVSNAKPHDLYFYSDPLEMIAGQVEAPKIFLNASAVLERQFAAYCMDSWIRSGVPESAIPNKVGVCLRTLNNPSNNVFPFNFLGYVKQNITNRLNSFIQLFPELTDSTKEELHRFAKGDGLNESPMYVQILKAFQTLEDERKSINENIKSLDDMLEDLKKKVQDSTFDAEIKELKMEKRALQNVKKSMGEKNTFNFLSDEGFLPNYAFPEAGVILKTILYRRQGESSQRKQQNQLQKSEKMVYEYQRSASSAIVDFAPKNTFYADGRHMEIDQIDVSTSEPTRWRLCPSCSYAQIEEAGKNTDECPRCHSTGWADVGQVKTMLKVRMVYSNSDYRKSMINDDSDNRKVTFYNKQLLVDVDEDRDVQDAYQMDNDEFPFGYEYVQKATLREINFGENDFVGQKVMVAGQEGVAKGFRICKYCGKIIPEKSKEYNEREHSRFCKTRKMSAKERNKAIEDCLFLYREFYTEALRILVPATALDVVATESFVAAFMLGLKQKFGNIDHLRATISEVPVPDSAERKQYLVIYDSVPGGTGYLKQFRTGSTDKPEDNLMVQVLQLALSVMENCSCKDDPQRDGCYHCLYAYRQSQDMGNISRSAAVKLLKQILNGTKNLVRIKKISDIDTNKIFDSELERSFIKAFEELSTGQRKITVENDIVNGRQGYLLKIEDVAWNIEPQVLLDAEQNVGIKCKPDFILWPITQSYKLPVAVFTDGFKYHKDIVADDTLKREAIRRSGNFVVWSLSYNDVQNVFKSEGNYCTNSLDYLKMPSGLKIDEDIKRKRVEVLELKKQNSFELLLLYLTDPEVEKKFEIVSNIIGYSLMQRKLLTSQLDFIKWNEVFSKIAAQTSFTDHQFEQGKTLFGSWSPRSSQPLLKMLAGVDVREVKKFPKPDVVAILEDRKDLRGDTYEEEWNGFWKFWNVMQFLPHFVGVCEEGMANGAYSALPLPSIEQPIDQLENSDDEWQSLFKKELAYSDDEAKLFAEKAHEAGAPLPDEIGYEVSNAAGATIAAVEIAWIDKKVGYMTAEQLADRDELVKMGWTIWDASEEPDFSVLGGEK
jgi:DEAD/DEAH box helicase domain-containing protein